MGSPEGKSIISNPVAIHDANNKTMVFCLCGDGQVYYQQQDADRFLDFGKWLAVGSKLPFEAGGTDEIFELIFQVNFSLKMQIVDTSIKIML